MNVVGHTSQHRLGADQRRAVAAARQLHPPAARRRSGRRSAAGPRRSAWAFARTSSAAAPTTRSTRSTAGSSSGSFPAEPAAGRERGGAAAALASLQRLRRRARRSRSGTSPPFAAPTPTTAWASRFVYVGMTGPRSRPALRSPQGRHPGQPISSSNSALRLLAGRSTRSTTRCLTRGACDMEVELGHRLARGGLRRLAGLEAARYCVAAAVGSGPALRAAAAPGTARGCRRTP